MLFNVVEVGEEDKEEVGEFGEEEEVEEDGVPRVVFSNWNILRLEKYLFRPKVERGEKREQVQIEPEEEQQEEQEEEEVDKLQKEE